MTVVDAWHGTSNGYTNLGCRCDQCKAWGSERNARYRAQNADSLRSYRAAYYAANGEKKRKYSNEWYALNRQKARDRTYGLAPGRYDEMLAEQENRCAVCKGDFGDKTPNVDHDHSCCAGNRSCGRCVRGLLCLTCNVGLGSFGDDLERLRSAITYLTST